MTGLTLLLLISGFAILLLGGEALVRGASSLGKTLGLPALIIGLTIVSFATSAPELAVSVDAALSGNPGLAVGNVVGSNIANILFVLGLTAVFAALVVRVQLIRADIPVMIGFSALALLLALDGGFSTADGGILLGLLLGYLVVTIWVARRRSPGADADQLGAEEVLTARPGGSVVAALRATLLRSVIVDLVLLVAGATMLVVGARFLVDAATTVASSLGVSDLTIGLTVVAIGTSLPELATSVVAAVRGQRDMAVGNLVGSNIFNIGAVLGVTSIVSSGEIPIDAAAVHFDLPVMFAAALVLLPLAFTGRVISQWEGALLVGIYVAYVAYLVLSAGQHAALQPFSAAMLWFVLPMTAMWLTSLVGYELGLRRPLRTDEEEEPVDYLRSPRNGSTSVRRPHRYD